MLEFSVNTTKVNKAISAMMADIGAFYHSADWSKVADIIKEDGYVAGGFIRDAIYGIDFKDVDIFFKSEESILKLMKISGDNPGMFDVFDNCLSVETYGPTKSGGLLDYSNSTFGRSRSTCQFQLITKAESIGEIEQVISGFDSNINMVAYDIANKEIVADDRFPIALMNVQNDDDRHSVISANLCLFNTMLGCVDENGNWNRQESTKGTFFGKVKCPESQEEAEKALHSSCSAITRVMDLQSRMSKSGVDVSTSKSCYGKLLATIVDFAYEMGKSDLDLDPMKLTEFLQSNDY